MSEIANKELLNSPDFLHLSLEDIAKYGNNGLSEDELILGLFHLYDIDWYSVKDKYPDKYILSKNPGLSENKNDYTILKIKDAGPYRGVYVLKQVEHENP